MTSWFAIQAQASPALPSSLLKQFLVISTDSWWENLPRASTSAWIKAVAFTNRSSQRLLHRMETAVSEPLEHHRIQLRTVKRYLTSSQEDQAILGIVLVKASSNSFSFRPRRASKMWFLSHVAGYHQHTGWCQLMAQRVSLLTASILSTNKSCITKSSRINLYPSYLSRVTQQRLKTTK